MFYLSKLLAPLTPRDGRVSQLSYLLKFVLPFVAVLGFTWLVVFAAPGLMGTPGYYIVALGWAVVLSTGDAHNIRRWRDLGSSAALYKLLRPCLVLLPALAFALQFLVPAQLAMAGDMQSLAFLVGMEFGGVGLQPAPLALLAITFALVMLNVVYLSVTPGQQGANSYGPDPYGGEAFPAFAGASGGVSDSHENDPVQRALADYHARQAAAERPVAPAAVGPVSFGKKRG
jgi:uncharacterized membrane protein YhaH (DUF805 family)